MKESYPQNDGRHSPNYDIIYLYETQGILSATW
jgi:hypothetical protein